MARLTARQIKWYLVWAGATAEQAETLAAIAMGESSGNTDAHALTSKEDSWGLYQVNRYAWPQYSEECLREPVCSSKAALAIAATARGYGHWTQYTNGGYRRFLPVGEPVPPTAEDVADAGTVADAPGGGDLPFGIALPPLPTRDELKKAGIALAVIIGGGVIAIVSIQQLGAAAGRKYVLPIIGGKGEALAKLAGGGE